jgi:hypothetical protein
MIEPNTALDAVRTGDDEPAAIAQAELDVYCWRLEQLLAAGYSQVVADQLADDAVVDLHRACDLLARGCDEATAYRIVT